MERKTLRIYCNEVLGGWDPYKSSHMVGAGEKLIMGIAELAQENGYDTTVYYNGTPTMWHNVMFQKREDFKGWEYSDIFIAWKDMDIWEQSIEANKKYHYTSEMRLPEGEDIEYLGISPYHIKRLLELTGKNAEVMPCGVDDIPFVTNKENIALYSSAPERGLNNIAEKWTLEMPKLYTSYGWESFELYNLGNPTSMKWRDDMKLALGKVNAEQTKRYSQTELKEIYLQAKYWLHPLNHADSELFCVSAVEAQLAGCIPVIKREGALQTTVLHAIEWDKFTGSETLTTEQLLENRKHAEQFLWSNIIKLWIDKWEK